MHEFTKRAEGALENTRDFAIENNYSYIGTEHILYGLVKEQKGLASRILLKQNITEEYIKEQILKIDGILNKKIVKEPELTPRAKRVLETSIKEAKKMGYNYVGTEHILLALMKETDSIAIRILIDASVDPAKIFADLLKVVSDESPIPNIYTKEQATPTLNMYSEDLTRLALDGKLDKIIGREEEIARLIQILTRRTKNNPLIIGEAGVGKTSIANALAINIVKGKVPKELAAKKILLLDISSMLAGAKYRGDFEERFKKCIDEAKKANVILFIDEMRTIIGAGSAEGALDAANILKPHLSRNEIQIIGATTREEYTKYIEKDTALNRRFQLIELEEPNEVETVKILKGIKNKYEKYHNVKITDDAIKQAVKLAIRYILDRNLPDKAIDVIDEACSKAKFKCEYNNEQSIENLKDKILEIKNKKRVEEKAVLITEKDVEQVVAKWSKIPVEKIGVDDKLKLRRLDQNLKQKIIGQDEAVEKIAKAIKRNRIGIRDPKRPIASFLLTGPTGVGKTALVKALAGCIFDDENKMVRIDMSEYMEAHSVSKLIGAPPGYVGFSEGGYLTEKIRKSPYNIILFDEIEKAHQDIYNVLLQILDDGRLTDGLGRTIDFKNTICIMTSNIGARNIVNKKSVGFVNKTNEKEQYEAMKKQVLDEVNKKFSPEFINRLDDIIVFNKLDFASVKRITRLMLKDVEERAKLQGMKLRFEDSIVEYIAKTGIDDKFGARPLKRTIQTKIEDKFADYMLSKNIDKKDKRELYFYAKNDQIVIADKHREKETIG